MTSFSMNTELLAAMATELTREAGIFEHGAVAKIHKLAIPESAIPVFAFGFNGSYARLHASAEQGATALQSTVTSIGDALGRVAAYYQRMEQQQGKDFDTGAAKIHP